MRNPLRHFFATTLLLMLLLVSWLPAAEGEADFSPATLQYEFASGLLRKGLFADAAKAFDDFLHQYPKDGRAISARLYRGEAYYALGDFKQAGQDYYDVLTSGDATSHLLARLRYGACLYELGRLQDATLTLTPLVQNPQTTAALLGPARYYYGRSLQGLRKYDAALAALAQVQDEQLRGVSLYAIGEIHSEEKRFQKAAASFGRLVTVNPNHPLAMQARLRQAEALRAAGDYAVAGDTYRMILEQDESPTEMQVIALRGLAWVRLQQKQYAEVLRLTQALLASSDPALQAAGQHLTGLAYFQQGQYAEAVAAFAKIKTGEFAAPSRLKQAWALYLTASYDQAQESLDAYLALQPDGAHTGESAYLQGRIAGARDAWLVAVKAFAQAERIASPFRARAAYEHALALEKAGKTDLAIAAYQQTLEQYPAHAHAEEILVGLGRLLMASRRYEPALQIYARLARREGLSEKLKLYALNQQAICFYWLGQYENMRVAYESLIKAYPESEAAPEAYYWLGWQYGRVGRHAAAVASYRKLLAKFPAHDLASKAKYALAGALFRDQKKDEAATVIFALTKGKDASLVADRELLWLGQRLVGEGKLKDADRVYEMLLTRRPGGLLQAVTLNHQAEVKRQAEAYAEAQQVYEKLLAFLEEYRPVDANEAGFVRSLVNEGRFGLAVCLRQAGAYEQARAMLDAIEVQMGDPYIAVIHFERGLLEQAAGNSEIAAEYLMRVGLLVDDAELAGQAILRAGEVCLEVDDLKKARICFEELAGVHEESYGREYPQSLYVEKGREMLRALDAREKKIAETEARP